jgi:signal transduction histidine kinase
MTTITARAGLPARRYRRLPWSRGAWGQAIDLAGAIPAQAVAGLPLLLLVVGARPDRPHLLPRLLLMWALALLVWLPLAYLLLPALTGVHRHRLRATAGIEVPRQPRAPGRLTRRGIVAAASSQATWRQLGYHMMAAPALALAGIAVISAWLAGIICTLAMVIALGLHPGAGLRQTAFTWPGGLFLTLAGVGMLLAAPWLTAGVATLDALIARPLLGPSRAEELENRVERLAQTRAGVVDAADAERRRLERDLHDGTQQRLVSLAMNLGMARVQATTTDDARLAIAEAHEEAKAALSELRDLIRGLHPAVLEDRGLDAALSGVAARMPIPVRLTVDLPRRPAAVIEAVAYFVVSEGLANIAKHAQASQAEVIVQRAGDRLHVIVSDDGVGGADPARGTGLAGLARRAASVDGALEVTSPTGGPTLLTVDLPCSR